MASFLCRQTGSKKTPSREYLIPVFQAIALKSISRQRGTRSPPNVMVAWNQDAAGCVSLCPQVLQASFQESTPFLHLLESTAIGDIAGHHNEVRRRVDFHNRLFQSILCLAIDARLAELPGFSIP